MSDNTNTDLPRLEHKSPLEHLLEHEVIAAFLLLFSGVAAIVCANSGLAEWYHHFKEFEFGLDIGGLIVAKSLHHWVNDGLMCIFFFVVGLEIKREVLVGELASPRRALLPIVAAIGGMAVPALVYWVFTRGTEGAAGWGIPMATDIAFAAGCLALLGKRIPTALGAFLIALAIVDDLGAVLVIALFYTGGIHVFPLVAGIVLIAVSFLISRLGVRHTFPYAVIGVLLWLAFLESGIHATVAGVLLAFTIPPNARYETPLFARRIKELIGRFQEAEDHKDPLMVNERQQSLIRSMTKECQYVEAPLQRIEEGLHPIALFVVMPVFAFFNAGIHLELDGLGAMVFQPVTVGVFFGLILGKQVGIMLCSWLAVKAGWASLPEGIRWRQVYGLSWLAAIGFTMGLFIDELAFTADAGTQHAEYLAQGKLGILLASVTAGVVGLLILRASFRGEVSTLVERD